MGWAELSAGWPAVFASSQSHFVARATWAVGRRLSESRNTWWTHTQLKFQDSAWDLGACTADCYCWQKLTRTISHLVESDKIKHSLALSISSLKFNCQLNMRVILNECHNVIHAAAISCRLIMKSWKSIISTGFWKSNLQRTSLESLLPNSQPPGKNNLMFLLDPFWVKSKKLKYIVERSATAYSAPAAI